MEKKSCSSVLGNVFWKAVLIDAALLLAVGAVCWLGGWREARNFIDGVFVAGILALVVGGVGVVGSSGFAKDPDKLYHEEQASTIPYEKRIRLMATEKKGGEAFMLQMGLAGLLLIALNVVLYGVWF